MPKKKPNLTAPMRRVLEKLKRTKAIYNTRTGYAVWLDTAETIPKTFVTAMFEMFLPDRLVEFRLVGATYRSELRIYRITPAGRRALKEG